MSRGIMHIAYKAMENIVLEDRSTPSGRKCVNREEKNTIVKPLVLFVI